MIGYRLMIAAAVVAGVSLATGCGENKPPENVKKMEVVDTTAAPAPVVPEEGATPAQADTTVDTPAVDAPAMDAPAVDAPAVDAPAEVSEPAVGEAATAAGGTYVIEPNDDSEILWTGYKTTGHREGGFANFSGSVTAPGGDITQGQVKVEVDLASLFSDSNILTGVLKGEGWFNTPQNKTATFESTKIEKTDDGYKVTGNLNMVGVSVGIAFPAEITVEEDAITATSEFTMMRSLWGIDTQGFEDQFINDDVLVKFNIVATKAEDAAK